MVAGLQVFTSLNMTGERQGKPWRQQESGGTPRVRARKEVKEGENLKEGRDLDTEWKRIDTIYETEDS